MQGGYFTGGFVFICDAFDFLPGMEVFKSARPENTIYIKVVERPCLTFQIDFLPDIRIALRSSRLSAYVGEVQPVKIR